MHASGSDVRSGSVSASPARFRTLGASTEWPCLPIASVGSVVVGVAYVAPCVAACVVAYVVVGVVVPVAVVVLCVVAGVAAGAGARGLSSPSAES